MKCKSFNEAMLKHRGKDFTLPGQTGFEKYTLELAKRWGADVIRDSEGTHLSDEIIESGYGIYSTICIIRGHNAWLKENPEARQSTFLCTKARMATTNQLSVPLMEDFFQGQFQIDDRAISFPYWEVYDRTTNGKIAENQWTYDSNKGEVIIHSKPWHEYTVSFLAWRVWEEINMYNHTTNSWVSEPLIPLQPYNSHARAYILDWLKTWCEDHPHTTVVRFTSLFYNFAWIWGSDPNNQNLFTDWASYDFTVSPEALNDFAEVYGYRLNAEDFVRQGKYNATHRIPSKAKLDWMSFIQKFVLDLGKELIDVVHSYGKKAYVFYDDSWVGIEPYNGKFEEFGFDGLIKCVFSAFEARLCANVPVETHELRLHPYLFPVGLGGAPTFSEGGHPDVDALEYWVKVRRALLRQPVDRLGLGGYISLTKDYPEFLEAIDLIMYQFRIIKSLHQISKPLIHKAKIAVLTSWGSLRSWTLSGHFHETDNHVLIHVIEALAGMDYEIAFLSFEDLAQGIPEGIGVIINAGQAGDAWSGGNAWSDNHLVENINQWVFDGGVFLGFGEPSAIDGYHTNLRLANILGIDVDHGEYACHGRRKFSVDTKANIIPKEYSYKEEILDIILLNPDVKVLSAKSTKVHCTLNRFGRGYGAYLSNFIYDDASVKLLKNLLLTCLEEDRNLLVTSNKLYVDVTVFPELELLVLTNNSNRNQEVQVAYEDKICKENVEPYGLKVISM
jgi:beta-D-galactosyl-(1->4)-L-rhamnose phosphorylase